MSAVRFEGVSKLFGSVTAVSELSLDIADGEFLVLVGPSGCGKTTSLRMLAGFERPTYGTVYIDGQGVNTKMPKDRDLAMVFQSYALYPHMTVLKNLSFGLKVRREKRDAIRPQIDEVAKTLDIEKLLDRRPSELSGGQRQRVALGRALLRRPKAFLMDEPLSNLDAALRVQMRAELKRLHERFGITTVYVTHDQVEAMTMGSRIALMNHGVLQQCATPEHIYDRPANLFSASFIGSPKMSLAPGRVSSDDGDPAIECLGVRTPVQGDHAEALKKLDRAAELIVGIRPEDLRWSEDAPASHPVRLNATVDVVEPLGSETFVVAHVADQSLTARFPPRSGVGPGAEVELALHPAHLHLFDAQTGRNALSMGSDQANSKQSTVDDEAALASERS
jgi:multiple sugar transport system ATP-binding protein